MPASDDEHHVAALAAVAAIGSTARNVRFPPKRGCAVAAAAGGHEDARAVSEHGRVEWTGRRRGADRRVTGSAAG